MTDFEGLSTAFGALGALSGLLSLYVSWRTSKRQTELALATHEFERRSAAAAHHGKYSDLLRDVIRSTVEARRAIRQAAATSLDQIYSTVDMPAFRDGLRRTDHLVDEACELTFKAIKHELSHQYGAHLRWRLNGLRNGSWDTRDSFQNPTSCMSKLSRVWQVMKRRVISRSNVHAEWAVWESDRFQRLLRKVHISISQQPLTELKAKISSHVNVYQAAFEAHCAYLGDQRQRLEDALKDNRLEEFPLSETSPRLLSLIKQEISGLDILVHLSLDEHVFFPEMDVQHLQVWIVFFATILYIAQNQDSWCCLDASVW